MSTSAEPREEEELFTNSSSSLIACCNEKQQQSSTMSLSCYTSKTSGVAANDDISAAATIAAVRPQQQQQQQEQQQQQPQRRGGAMILRAAPRKRVLSPSQSEFGEDSDDDHHHHHHRHFDSKPRNCYTSYAIKRRNRSSSVDQYQGSSVVIPVKSTRGACATADREANDDDEDEYGGGGDTGQVLSSAAARLLLPAATATGTSSTEHAFVCQTSNDTCNIASTKSDTIMTEAQPETIPTTTVMNALQQQQQQQQHGTVNTVVDSGIVNVPDATTTTTALTFASSFEQQACSSNALAPAPFHANTINNETNSPSGFVHATAQPTVNNVTGGGGSDVGNNMVNYAAAATTREQDTADPLATFLDKSSSKNSRRKVVAARGNRKLKKPAAARAATTKNKLAVPSSQVVQKRTIETRPILSTNETNDVIVVDDAESEYFCFDENAVVARAGNSQGAGGKRQKLTAAHALAPPAAATATAVNTLESDEEHGQKQRMQQLSQLEDAAYARLERFAENCIFKYFKLGSTVGGPMRVEATCNLCSRNVRATVGVTSNFLTHLRTHHKATFQQYEQHRSEVATRRGRPLKSLHQMRQRFSFAMRKRRRDIIFSAFTTFETTASATSVSMCTASTSTSSVSVATTNTTGTGSTRNNGLGSSADVSLQNFGQSQARVSAQCKLCGVTIRGTKTVSSNFYSHLKRKHSEQFSELNSQAEEELGEMPAIIHAQLPTVAVTDDAVNIDNFSIPSVSQPLPPTMTMTGAQQQPKKRRTARSAFPPNNNRRRGRRCNSDFFGGDDDDDENEENFDDEDYDDDDEEEEEAAVNIVFNDEPDEEEIEDDLNEIITSHNINVVDDEEEDENDDVVERQEKNNVSLPNAAASLAAANSTAADYQQQQQQAQHKYYTRSRGSQHQSDAALQQQQQQQIFLQQPRVEQQEVITAAFTVPPSHPSSLSPPVFATAVAAAAAAAAANAIIIRNLNSILVSAELGGKHTDLVMAHITKHDDYCLLMPPMQQLFDFLSRTTQPRTGSDGFVLYSFEADCLRIVAELRKMGFQVINMNYSPTTAPTAAAAAIAAAATQSSSSFASYQHATKPAVHANMNCSGGSGNCCNTGSQQQCCSCYTACTVCNCPDCANVLSAAPPPQQQQQTVAAYALPSISYSSSQTGGASFAVANVPYLQQPQQPTTEVTVSAMRLWNATSSSSTVQQQVRGADATAAGASSAARASRDCEKVVWLLLASPMAPASSSAAAAAAGTEMTMANAAAQSTTIMSLYANEPPMPATAAATNAARFTYG